MRAVNLIPPEERRGERAPLRAGPLAYIVVGVLVFAFIAVYAIVSTGNSIAERETEVATLEQQLESSSARAAALKSFSDFAALEDARNQTVSDLATSRFDWERVLRELALVLPAGITLNQVSGSASSADGETGSAQVAAPNLTMNGCATEQTAVATLVAALRDIDGVTRVGLASSATATGDSGAAVAPATQDSSGGTGTQGCPPSRPTSFQLTIAFDDAAAAAGGVVPPGSTPPDVGSGVGEAQAERDAAGESVEDARDSSQKAADRYIPGA